VKHPRERDVPHTRKRPLLDGGGIHPERRVRTDVSTRVPMENGKSFPARSLRAGEAPKRPPICMLFDDLADETPPPQVFGMYPSSLIPKLLPWLRCERRALLHVCSGGLPRGEGLRVDIRPDALPDIVADGRALPFADGAMPAIMIDPPYTEHYARELYGVEYPLPSHLLREACRVVRPGGRIALVHYLVANPPKGAHHVKTFGLSMGFGYPMRAVTIYERDQEGLAL
jgi:SAM-dependent methyltransferase